jgi:hypothetical protein
MRKKLRRKITRMTFRCSSCVVDIGDDIQNKVNALGGLHDKKDQDDAYMGSEKEEEYGSDSSSARTY